MEGRKWYRFILNPIITNLAIILALLTLKKISTIFVPELKEDMSCYFYNYK